MHPFPGSPMKITIDLTGIADEVDWKFYQSLGGILQSHMIELIQSGNLSLPLLGDIYRRISDHLAESEGAKLPRSADLADAVFQSFLGDETENILTASLNDMTAPQSFSGDGNEMKLLSQWGLMDEVRKTQADIKCEQFGRNSGDLCSKGRSISMQFASASVRLRIRCNGSFLKLKNCARKEGR